MIKIEFCNRIPPIADIDDAMLNAMLKVRF